MKKSATAAMHWTAVALLTAAHPAGAGGNTVGATLEAESLNRQLSANYHVAEDELHEDLRYVGYVDVGSVLCYDDVDLTGVRSIELEYARCASSASRAAASSTWTPSR